MNIGSRDTCPCDRRQGIRTLLDVPKAAHVWVTATRFAWSFDTPIRAFKVIVDVTSDPCLAPSSMQLFAHPGLHGKVADCCRVAAASDACGTQSLGQAPAVVMISPGYQRIIVFVVAAGPAAGGDIPGLPDRLHIGVAASVLTSLELHQYMRVCTLYCRSGACGCVAAVADGCGGGIAALGRAARAVPLSPYNPGSVEQPCILLVTQVWPERNGNPPVADGRGGGVAAPGRTDIELQGDTLSLLPAAGLTRAVGFLRWLTGVVTASLHPGAPHARQQAALELTTMLLDVWDDQVTVHFRQESLMLIVRAATAILTHLAVPSIVVSLVQKAAHLKYAVKYAQVS